MMKNLLTTCAYGALAICLSAFAASGRSWAGGIALAADASALEQYAALELQRYLYQVCDTKLDIRTGTAPSGQGDFVLKRDSAVPGPQGYSLKRVGETVTIAGSDAEGLLYGVYGLLQDHYGVGFYLGGDVLPEDKKPLMPATLDETRKPAVAIRGFLPWTNFPQSPSSYAWEDWKFIIDQMAKMRLNFLHIHNYTGQGDHNEMYHNFTLNGWMSRVWMNTAKTGHGWDGPGWDVNQYRFGAADLFDDYDFGADCTLHNESLDNAAVFRKGASQFQKIIAYAHSRGVKIGLGLDIDMILGSHAGYKPLPSFPKQVPYPAKASAPEVVKARVAQIGTDYPDLDYLICFQSETIAHNKAKLEEWQGIFEIFYNEMKRQSPATRMAVAGWGISNWTLAKCAPDVICAPIGRYSAAFDRGASYGKREYWGCPWLETDGDPCSNYYYPYGLNLSASMNPWRSRAPNMTGLYCLTWRLTDAIDPKLSYISNAPWHDGAGPCASQKSVYRDYAERNYGAAADAVTAIINQGEPVALQFGECRVTPYFRTKNNGRRTSFRGALQNMPTGGMDQHAKAVEQLKVIDSRIATAPAAQAERLKQLRCRIAAAADHILLNHQFENKEFKGQANLMQSWVRNFTHRVTDISSLGTIVSMQNRFVQLNYVPLEKNFRPATPVDASLHPVVISPPASVPAGQAAAVKVRVLDSRDQAAVTATLHWRLAGTEPWNAAPMTRRVKAIFTGSIPATGLIEYHLTVAEGDRNARFPVAGNLSFVTTGAAPAALPATPANLRVENRVLNWDAVPDAFWYRIYRDDQLLTYVASDTLQFKDDAPGFDGRPMTGQHAYRITAVDKADYESQPTDPVKIK